MIKKINLKKAINKSQNQVNIGIIGGGSWATAIIKILSEHKSTKLNWWLRDNEARQHIRKFRRNPSYLTDVIIKKRKVRIFSDIQKAVKESEYIIIVVPAAFVKNALLGLNKDDFQGKQIISAVKGIVPDEHLLVSELLAQKYDIPVENLGVVAGPCHAEEVALEKQSFLTISSQNSDFAETFAQLMTCRYIQSNPNNDILGIEYAAVIKNIVALACGIAHGLNYGDNFQAVLVSNAMQEIRRFVEAVSPLERDMNASAYLGDLLVTAYSQFSRNRTFGNMIGRGYTIKSAQMEMNMIAEGYYAVKSIHEINKDYEVSMPIAEAVYKVLYENTSARVAMEYLKDRLS